MIKVSKSYSDNYKQLEDISKQLQQEQNNPNLIDELAVMLEKASQSYTACKERIESVEKFMKEFEGKHGESKE